MVILKDFPYNSAFFGLAKKMTKFGDQSSHENQEHLGVFDFSLPEDAHLHEKAKRPHSLFFAQRIIGLSYGLLILYYYLYTYHSILYYQQQNIKYNS